MKHTTRIIKIFIILSTLALFYACGPKSGVADGNKTSGRLLENSYASGFQVEEVEGGKILTIKHPNDHSRTFQKILLYKAGSENESTGYDYQLKVPLKRVALMSVTHIGFLDAINAIESVAAVTDPFRIYNKAIQKGINNAKIADLGGSMVPDVEKIFALKPEAVFMSGFPNAKEKNRVISEAGIPIFYTVAWTEKTPLARAEWIKFFGHLFGQEAKADSIFKKVECNYKALVAMADSMDSQPRVFSGNSFKGVWYLPGGNSYVSTLIDDAGGMYIFKNDTTSGSMAVSFEVVYNEARNADYWLNVQEQSIAEMLNNDNRYNDFKPVQTQQVYNRQASGTLNGGNDYFETGSWRPDLVLKDLIYILHPETGTAKLKFYKRLSE